MFTLLCIDVVAALLASCSPLPRIRSAIYIDTRVTSQNSFCVKDGEKFSADYEFTARQLVDLQVQSITGVDTQTIEYMPTKDPQGKVTLQYRLKGVVAWSSVADDVLDVEANIAPLMHSFRIYILAPKLQSENNGVYCYLVPTPSLQEGRK